MVAGETSAVARISRARQLLAEAKDLTDIKAVKDMAEAARLYARAKHLGLEAENEAAEIKVRADRKLGETLAATPKHPPGPAPEIGRPGRPISEPPTLADLGITKDESANAQAVAAIPAEVFEQAIAETKEAGKRIETKPLVREGRKRKREQVAAAMGRSRHAARTADESLAPVNTQNIQDARLRKAFSKCLQDAAQIAAYAPSRVAEVLTTDRADQAIDTLDRLTSWTDRFRAARGGGPRLVGDRYVAADTGD